MRSLIGPSRACAGRGAIIVIMAAYDVHHSDPHPVARSAAVRSGREQDPLTREDARRLNIDERLAAGCELSRAAVRMLGAATGRAARKS